MMVGYLPKWLTKKVVWWLVITPHNAQNIQLNIPKTDFLFQSEIKLLFFFTALFLLQ